MPEANCDSRVHLMLVAHADSLGFLLNPIVAFASGSARVIKFQWDQQTQWHHSMTLNQESFTWSYTKV